VKVTRLDKHQKSTSKQPEAPASGSRTTQNASKLTKSETIHLDATEQTSPPTVPSEEQPTYGTDHDVFAFDRPIILHATTMPPEYDAYHFKQAVNSKTRKPMSGHLENAAKATAIEHLLLWQQMQELSWSVLVDLITMYLMKTDEVLINTMGVKSQLKMVAEELKLIGSSPEAVDSLSFAKLFIQRRKAHIVAALQALRLHTPAATLPPSGLIETIIDIPGPITCSYTVVNQPLPRIMFPGIPSTIRTIRAARVSPIESKSSTI
jgi:hypothetical protein